MIRPIPVMLSILFSLLGIPFSFCDALAATEQMLLDFDACEARVVWVDLQETLDDDKSAIRPHDGNLRLAIGQARILSVVEGVLVLTPGGFSIVLKFEGKLGGVISRALGIIGVSENVTKKRHWAQSEQGVISDLPYLLEAGQVRLFRLDFDLLKGVGEFVLHLPAALPERMHCQ